MAAVKKRRFFKKKKKILSNSSKEDSKKSIPAVVLSSIKQKPSISKDSGQSLPRYRFGEEGRNDKEKVKKTNLEKESKKANKVIKGQAIKSPKNSGFITEQPREKIFPKIRRFITERILWTSLLVGILLGVLILKLFLIQQTLEKKQSVMNQRASIMKKIAYWQGITKKYPNYRDGFFIVANLEYRLGNKKEAMGYIHKTLQLDPNFGEAGKLQRLIGE